MNPAMVFKRACIVINRNLKSDRLLPICTELVLALALDDPVHIEGLLNMSIAFCSNGKVAQSAVQVFCPDT
jgi:hypothetical protein